MAAVMLAGTVIFALVGAAWGAAAGLGLFMALVLRAVTWAVRS